MTVERKANIATITALIVVVVAAVITSHYI